MDLMKEDVLVLVKQKGKKKKHSNNSQKGCILKVVRFLGSHYVY